MTLRLDQLREIAAAAAARTREERAVARYLGLGRRRPRAAQPAPQPLLLAPGAADLEAFDGDGERRLRRLVARLSIDERRELLALVHYAKSPLLGFERAMRRAQRIPSEAQMGYLMGRRLERDIPLAIDRLGESSKSSGGVS